MLNFYIIGDIGNTDIKICVYKNKNIVKKIRLSTNKVNLKYLKKNLNVLRKYDKKLKHILFCSVVPNCYKKIKNYFKLYFNTNCNELKNLNLSKLLSIKVNRKQIGSDRLANAISVIDNKNNYIVVDFGTATNFDVISSNSYNGGLIAPGIKLSIENLFSSTALLPMFKFKKYPKNYGKNTKEALGSGFFWGYEGLINNILRKIIKKNGINFKIILTGGYSSIFKNRLIKRSKIENNITIQGIINIYKYFLL